MFRRLFNRKKKGLAKDECWEKYELCELFDDVEQATKLLSEYNEGYSNHFLSTEEFHSGLSEELYDLQHQNVPDFYLILIWFAPTSDWDDIIGQEGLELGNRIFNRTNRWQKRNKANC